MMKINRIVPVLMLILLPSAVSGQRHIDIIRSDRAQEQISEKDYIVNLGYALFAPERLPERYRPQDDRPIKCGTTIVANIQRNLALMTVPEQQLFAQYLSRPSFDILPESYVTPEGHFKIHYTVTHPPEIPEDHRVPLADTDQNGIPDFVEEAGRAFERSYRYEVDTLGYNPMPVDHRRNR